MSWRNHKYLRFTWAETSDTGKTHVYSVQSRSGDDLGVIEWYAPWRQYTFDPEPFSSFNSGCLDGISAFLSEANANRATDITGDAS